LPISKINISEEELVLLLQKGNKEGIDILYDNYSATLYGVINKIVGSEEIAKDVLQDTFVKIWKNFSNYERNKGRLFTWILNIARNTSIDYIRSKEFKNKNLTQNNLNNVKEINKSETKTDHIGLTNILELLDPNIKEVIDAIYLKGYTHAETAEYLNLPIGTVKSRVRNGLIQLRKLIK